MKEHVHDDGAGPDVNRFGVGEVAEDLRGHVEHCAAF